MASSCHEAEPLARHAVELDPGYARAYAILAESQLLKFFLDSRQEILNEALVYAKRPRHSLHR